MMDDLKEQLDRMVGRTKPKTFKICFVVSDYVEPSIIFGDDLDWLINDMLSTNELDGILDNGEMKKMPKEVGIYSADLIIHSFKSNHPLDPEEWDMTIKIDKIERIELSYKDKI